MNKSERHNPQRSYLVSALAHKMGKSQKEDPDKNRDNLIGFGSLKSIQILKKHLSLNVLICVKIPKKITPVISYIYTTCKFKKINFSCVSPLKIASKT
jgi:hypothetical protein